MTAAMAFEAPHHAGSLNANLLVVLNDNDMLQEMSEHLQLISPRFSRARSMRTSARRQESVVIMPPVKNGHAAPRSM